MAMLIALGGVAVDPQDPDRHLPEHQYPGHLGDLELRRAAAGGDGEARSSTNFERFLTTIVSDIDHVESQTLTGISIIKIYLQPGAERRRRRSRRPPRSRRPRCAQMPPGAVPPLIMQYSATSVPIMMLALETDTLSEQQLFDYGINFVRVGDRDDPGRADPVPVRRQAAPDHGRHRSARLHGAGTVAASTSRPRSPQQNVILPSGTAKIGVNEYPIVIDSVARDARRARRAPDQDGRRQARSTSATSRTCATARSPQTNMVHVEGQRSVLMVDPEERRRLDARRHRRREGRRCRARSIGCPKEARGHLT